jgi:hypothetical protein
MHIQSRTPVKLCQSKEEVAALARAYSNYFREGWFPITTRLANFENSYIRSVDDLMMEFTRFDESQAQNTAHGTYYDVGLAPIGLRSV